MALVNSSLFHRPETGEGLRISVAHYSADEVIQHFLGLYASLDFEAEMSGLALGFPRFIRRKRALREFRALSIALWGLALEKSFPDDAEAFFAAFLETTPFLADKGGEGARMRTRVNIYVDLLKEKKDANFRPVAAYVAEILASSRKNVPHLTMKLSLSIRNLYTLIFNRLV